MVFEIQREADREKVQEFLKVNNIPFEERDTAFDSVDGIYIYETLTHMFGVNPELDGDDVVDLVYQRTPKMAKKLFEQYKNDKGYGVEDSHIVKLEEAIFKFYTVIIEEELEEMVKEGIISKVDD